MEKKEFERFNTTYSRVCFHNYVIVTKVAFHFELIYRGCVIHPIFSFLSVVSHTHSDIVVASFAPYIVWHFKPDNYYSLVDLSGSFSEGVCPQEFIEPPDFRIVVRGVVFIRSFSFTHFVPDAIIVLHQCTI